jgi:putative phosphoribosyl transferase
MVLAVPVVQQSVADELEREVDELIYLLAPGDLFAIGGWYENFSQVTDEEVRKILARRAAEQSEALMHIGSESALPQLSGFPSSKPIDLQ